MIAELCEAFGVPMSRSAQGFEADDVIATLVETRARADTDDRNRVDRQGFDAARR